jgi:hypothetical protein
MQSVTREFKQFRNFSPIVETISFKIAEGKKSFYFVHFYCSDENMQFSVIFQLQLSQEEGRKCKVKRKKFLSYSAAREN